MPAGRPTKYNQEIADKTLEYVEGGYKLGDEPEVIPTVEGLSGYIDIRVSTIYEWAKEKPEFSEVLEKLKRKQARLLMSGGLAGGYNATIAKLILAKHDYSDSQVIKGDRENPLVTETRLPNEDRAILDRYLTTKGA